MPEFIFDPKRYDLPGNPPEATKRLYDDAPALLAYAVRVTAERHRLREALQLLLADCSEYEAWQRPCLAVYVARAALSREGGDK